MKRLSLYLFLLLFALPTPSQADDIRDFQIEGMSIGDRLLDYFSKSEINKFATALYPSSDKYEMMMIKSSKFKVYDLIQIEYLKNDSNYIIEAISGKIEFPKNIDRCINKRDEIVREIKNAYNLTTREYKPRRHSIKHPSSKVYETRLYFKNRDYLRIYCMDWSTKDEKEERYIDDLSVDFSTRKFLIWLQTEAYK